MTISTNMFDATVAVVAVAGTSVVPTLEIPDNCHTVVILNPDATNTVLVGLAAAGGALPISERVREQIWCLTPLLEP